MERIEKHENCESPSNAGMPNVVGLTTASSPLAPQLRQRFSRLRTNAVMGGVGARDYGLSELMRYGLGSPIEDKRKQV